MRTGLSPLLFVPLRLRLSFSSILGRTIQLTSSADNGLPARKRMVMVEARRGARSLFEKVQDLSAHSGEALVVPEHGKEDKAREYVAGIRYLIRSAAIGAAARMVLEQLFGHSPLLCQHRGEARINSVCQGNPGFLFHENTHPVNTKRAGGIYTLPVRNTCSVTGYLSRDVTDHADQPQTPAAVLARSPLCG